MNRFFARSSMLALVLLASGNTAQAEPVPTIVASAEPPSSLVTDRPDVAEASETVGRGRFQAELGTDVETDKQDGIRTVGLRTPMKLRFGISERVELHMETEVYGVDWVDGRSDGGLGDLDIGGKVHFLDGGGWVPSTGFLLALTLPSGNGPAGGGSIDLLPTVAADWELSSAWGLGVNLGATITLQSEQAADHLFRYAVAIGRSWAPLTERLRTYVEVFGESPFAGGDHLVSIDGGLAFLVTPQLQIDLVFRGGLSNPAPDFGGGIGLSFRR